MAHNVSRAFQIAEKPWVVQVNDTATRDFLAALNGGGASDLALVEETIALWAVQVPNDSVAGTAYVVSPEAYKRVQARRF